MNANERRNMWADRIERCLSSELTIEQWCRLNRICQSSLYKWMAEFRKSEPGRFPRRSSMASNWISVTRDGIADAQAIVPSVAAPSSATEATSGQDPLFAETGSVSKAVPSSPPAIRALVGTVELAIPPGAHESDIACVMRAAMTL